jgi:hypothetical protein
MLAACSAAVLGVGLLAGIAVGQPVIATAIATQYHVVTVTSASSPSDAGQMAENRIQTLAPKGWRPINITADVINASKEGTTIQGSNIWAVYVLMTCTRTATVGCKI